MKMCYKSLYTSFLLFILVQPGISQCHDVPISELDETNYLLVPGQNANDLFGYSVSDAGDVNGDGIPDVIIGAPNVDFGGNANVGEAYVIFGGTGITTSSFDITVLNGTNGFVIRGNVK